MLEKHSNITFQQDGVLPHVGNTVRQSLNAQYSNKEK